MITPVITSPIAMENLPSCVEHSTGPVTGWTWPPTVTFAAAAAGLDGAAAPVEAGLVDALDDDVAVVDDAPGDLLSFEQLASPATITAAAPAINNSRFTNFSSAWC
jgi:hypothetical protein